MRKQATRYTADQLDVIAHWEAQGYKFTPGEVPPPSKDMRPSWSARHPVADAWLSLIVILLGGAAAVTLLFGLVVGWLTWQP